MLRRLHLLLLAFVAAALAGCASPAPQGERPRLLVFMVVDGLPQRQVTAWPDQLAPDGLARFLDRGAWFADAHYGHAFTVTAAGHATMLTGAYPHRTGIIGNEWRDPQTGHEVYNTGDPGATYIGHPTRPLDGTSPRNLKVETLGDVLRRIDPRSKVISVSGKDRGAILPAGHAGTAYMYMSDDGQFATTTYYAKQEPPWVDAFNAARPADRWFRGAWQPLLPAPAYDRDLPDDTQWLRGGKLPMPLAGASAARPGPAYYASLLRSPYADALSLEFARAAVAGEGLGQDDAPDILVVSLSGHDYVNHGWSAESKMSHDHLLQLDRMLESFFHDLDRVVGADRYIAVLTADHGFMPAPEYARALGRDSGRIDSAQALARVEAGLQRKFGDGKWLLGFSSASLLIDKKQVAAKGLDLDAVADEARALLLAEPGFGTAYTRKELLSGSREGAPFFEASRNAWHPQVSGEVQFTLKPYWMFGSGSVATHGSPHPYDTQVPILMWGPRWIPAGRINAHVEEIDVAPTLARLLQVPAPAASEGHLLPLAPVR